MLRFAIVFLFISGVCAQETNTFQWIYPWVSNNSQYESIVFLNNWGEESATVSLKAQRGPQGNGTAFSKTIQVVIEPFGFLEAKANSLFPDMGSGSGFSILAESDRSHLSGGWVTNNLLAASMRSPSQGNALQIMPSDSVGTTLLYPYLPITGGLTSAPVIINASGASQSVHLAFYAPDGTLVEETDIKDLAPYQPFAAVANSLVPTGSPNISLMVSGTDLLCGAAFIFNGSNEPSIANAQALQPDDISTRLVYPWVSSNQQFESIVFANNTGDEPVSVNLVARRADGSSAQAQRTIPAHGFLEAFATQLFPGLGAGPGFAIELTADQRGVRGGWVTNNLQTPSGRSPSQGSAVLVPSNGANGVNVGTELIYRYLPVLEGLTSAPVVVSLAGEPVNVDLYFYNAQGQILTAKRLSAIEPLRPFAEVANTLAGSSENVTLIVSSESLLAGAAFVFNDAREPAIGNASAISPMVQPGFERKAQSSIGASGGNFATTDYEIIVPPGCFTANAQLSIWGPSAHFLPSEEPSGFYLAGIPDNYQLSITCKLRLAEGQSLPNEFRATAFGYSWELNRNLPLPAYRDFIKQGDFLVSNLPAANPGTRKRMQTGQTVGYFSGTIHKSKVSSGQHFRLSWRDDKVTETQADFVADALEEAYDFFQSIGFDYDARTSWPMTVSFVGLGDELFGQFGEPILGYNFGTIQLNENKANDLSEMAVTAFHEFFHMVQTFYHPDISIVRTRVFPDWFDEATAAWCEQYYSGAGPAHVPGNVIDNSDAVGYGVQYGSDHGGRGKKNHGYGMAPYIKYGIDYMIPDGKNAMARVYAKILNGQHRLVAFQSEFSNMEPEHFNDFAVALAEGLVFGFNRRDLPKAVPTMVDSALGLEQTWVFHHFPIDRKAVFPDLSLDLFDFKLNSQTVNDSYIGLFEVKGSEYAYANLFSYLLSNSPLTYLDASGKRLFLGRINSWGVAGETLSFMVTHYPNNAVFESVQDVSLEMSFRSVVFQMINQEQGIPIHILKPGEAFDPGTNRLAPNGGCRCTVLNELPIGDDFALRAGRNGQVLATTPVNLLVDVSNNGEAPLSPLLVTAIWDGSVLGVFYAPYFNGLDCRDCPKDGVY